MGVRITVSLTDENHRHLKQAAAERRMTLTALANEVIAAGLERGASVGRVGIGVHELGEPLVPMDKALQLTGELEDEALVEKLRRGK